jgi:hypothetical protein
MVLWQIQLFASFFRYAGSVKQEFLLWLKTVDARNITNGYFLSLKT